MIRTRSNLFNIISPTKNNCAKNNNDKINFGQYPVKFVKLKDLQIFTAPIFDSVSGRLRPGIYEMALEDIKKNKVFCCNELRQSLLNSFEKAIETYKQAGIKDIYITGSFSSTKTLPGDLDAFIIYDSKQYAKIKELKSIWTDFKGIPSKNERPKPAMWHDHKIEVVPVPISNQDNIISFFTAGNTKGLIKLKLD